jgi:regulator of sigma E protease
MDLLAQITGNFSLVLTYGVPFLFVLTVVVFFHELGHFMVARWCGVKIETFSVGFGRELFGFNDKHGTRWKFAWLPLGGYVKFLGDENVASAPDATEIQAMDEDARRHSFHHKPLAQRAAVVAAGPVANFILAIVIFAFVFSVFGRHITLPLVDKVQPGSAAEQGGFKAGDLVTRIDGRKITTFNEMQRAVSISANREMSFVVRRNNKDVALKATPRMREVKFRFGGTQRIGVIGIERNATGDAIIKKHYDPVTALGMAVDETWFIVERTGVFIYGLVMGRENVKQLSGPVRIAQLSGEIGKIGFDRLIHFIGLISVSIGLINLFPVPMLDGGHLLFYGIEALRGRPVSERVQEFGFRVGFALVVALMVFVTWIDYQNIF